MFKDNCPLCGTKGRNWKGKNVTTKQGIIDAIQAVADATDNNQTRIAYGTPGATLENVVGQLQPTGIAFDESALLKALLSHLMLKRDEAIIMDMEAGIEHLARGTAESMDAFLVVVEPSQKSVQTADSVMRLARDIGITRVFAVLNKVRNKAEESWLREHISGLPVLGKLTYNEQVIGADLKGIPAYSFDESFAREIRELKENLEKTLAPNK